MKLPLADGRTLCGLPDILHQTLCQSIRLLGRPSSDYTGFYHGPYVLDDHTTIVYHDRGDIYVPETNILTHYNTLNRPLQPV